MAGEQTYTEGLAEFIAGIRYGDIPAGVVAHAKLMILDSVGCGLLGAGLPWAVWVREALEGRDLELLPWSAGIGYGGTSTARSGSSRRRRGRESTAS